MKLSDEDKRLNRNNSCKKYYKKNVENIRLKNKIRYVHKKIDDSKIIQAKIEAKKLLGIVEIAKNNLMKHPDLNHKIESSLYLEEVKKELENI